MWWSNERMPHGPTRDCHVAPRGWYFISWPHMPDRDGTNDLPHTTPMHYQLIYALGLNPYSPLLIIKRLLDMFCEEGMSVEPQPPVISPPQDHSWRGLGPTKPLVTGSSKEPWCTVDRAQG